MLFSPMNRRMVDIRVERILRGRAIEGKKARGKNEKTARISTGSWKGANVVTLPVIMVVAMGSSCSAGDVVVWLSFYFASRLGFLPHPTRTTPATIRGQSPTKDAEITWNIDREAGYMMIEV